MRTLADLAIQMQIRSKEVPVAADNLKRQVAYAALDSLLENTPVDTSVLVSNWRVSSGAIAEPIPAYALGREGSTRETSIAAARAAGRAAIDGIAPGKPIVIFNSVPYAQFLNDGTSSRAPHMFIEKAVLVGNLLAKRLGLQLGVK